MKKFLSRSENAMEEMIEGTAPSVGKPSFDLADDEIRFSSRCRREDTLLTLSKRPATHF